MTTAQRTLQLNFLRFFVFSTYDRAISQKLNQAIGVNTLLCVKNFGE